MIMMMVITYRDMSKLDSPGKEMRKKINSCEKIEAYS